MFEYKYVSFVYVAPNDSQRLSKSRPSEPGQGQSQYDIHVFIGLPVSVGPLASMSSDASLLFKKRTGYKTHDGELPVIFEAS